MPETLRPTLYIVGFLLVGLFMVTIVVFMGQMNSVYPANYNESDIEGIEIYNNLTAITEQMEGLKKNATDISNPEESILDLIGSFFGRAWGSFKAIFKSFDVAFSIQEKATEELAGTGVNGEILNTITTVIGTIMLVLLVISVIFYIYFKVQV